jgi:hypothetical protein
MHVADNLEIAAMRGAEKPELKSSQIEPKPNKFKKRTDLKTGAAKPREPGKGRKGLDSYPRSWCVSRG